MIVRREEIGILKIIPLTAVGFWVKVVKDVAASYLTA
jgi:hypothetical protein